MTNRLENLTGALLDAAKKAGADAADAMVGEETSLSIDVLDGKLEHAERSEGVDLGLRVLIGQRQAIVSASDASAATITTMAERAVAMAREAPQDPYIGLADQDQLALGWDIAELELEDPSAEPAPAALEEDARRAEQAALTVSGVSQVQAASAGYGRSAFHLAASNGFSGGYARTSRSTYAVAISGEGDAMERDYKSESRIFQADLPTPEEIGRQAGVRAVARAGARQPPTGTYPVLFDRRVSSSLIGHVLNAINGATITRGGSWLRDALGEIVLPEALSLVEQPHRRRIAGSKPFDGEGLPTSERKIIDNGVLTGWILDLATARNLGMQSTGNAARGTSSGPSPSVSNVTLTSGARNPEEMLRDMGTGMMITSFMGSTINPTTGEYSRGASGFWVENGEVTYPVNECTIAGNLRDMLGRIIPSNDAEDHLSRRVPSLLLDGMVLAGG